MLEQFVIFGSERDVYKIAYKDIIDKPNISWITPTIHSNLINHIRGLIFKLKISTEYKLIRKLCNFKYFSNLPADNKSLCFIVFYDWYVMECGFIEYLREHYPQSKIVVTFHDLIQVKRLFHSGKKLNMPYLKAKVDLILTYDFKEANKYGITYHHVPYSYPKNNESNFEECEYDVYFLGQAKNRLNEIYDIYHKLKDLNLRLKFILAGVDVCDRIIDCDIEYLDNEQLAYTDNIKYVKKSKCLLEIIQKGSTGYTLRTLEAIAYGKKLLSNNPVLKNAEFYNKDLISIIENDGKLNNCFLKKLNENSDVTYNYKYKLSPLELLDFINHELKMS